MMTESKELAELLETVRAEATVLDTNGAKFSIERVLQLVKDVTSAAEPWMTFLSEGDAAIRCGRSPSWVRAQFERMERDNNARMVGRHRQYRQCALPRRADVDAAAERGRQAARQVRKKMIDHAVELGAQLSA